MKLLNHTTLYLADVLLGVLTIWAALFYYAMLDEIYDSMDDGLENQKLLVMQKAAWDSSVLGREKFEDGYYTIKQVQTSNYQLNKDVYQDTVMYMQNEKDYEPVRMLITLFKQDGQLYEMRVITSMVEEDDLIEDLVFSLIWLYLGLLASVLLLNNFILKRTWKPFYTLLDKLRQFRLDKPTRLQSEETGIDEFKLLNSTVQKLLQANIDTYRRQKEFIENAAHELQTPIGIIRNKLELMIEKESLSDNQLQELSQVMEQTNRMGRLNKSLLLLSKIENKQYSFEDRVDIALLISRLVEAFKEVAEFKNVRLEYKLENECHVGGNEELIYVLLNNLIKNAITHSKSGSVIKIIVQQKKLTISNAGDKPLSKDRIFTRFYKESGQRSSSGLGLAIAKAIADNHGFVLSYSYNKQHIFSLAL